MSCRHLSEAAIAAAAAAGLLLVLAARARALSVEQHPLPAYRCGSGRCPASPATAIMGEGSLVLAAGVEGGAHDVFSQVLLPAASLAPGPAGPPASAIAPGPDGDPWVLAPLGDGRTALLDVTPRGASTLYAFGVGEQPGALAVGLGAAWVAGPEGLDRIGGGERSRIAQTGEVRDVVVGPASSAWATAGAGAIVQAPSTGEAIARSSEPQPLEPLRAIPQLERIAVGPDGALWYTDSRGLIGRMSPQGAVREYAIPDHSPPYEPGAARPLPLGIVPGADGRMYFTDPGDNAIGTVTMTGQITEYPIPALAPVGPRDITLAGDEVVFDEGQQAALGTVDPTGTEASLATPPSIASVEAALRRVLAAGRPVATRALAHGLGFRLAVAPPEAGTLVVSWTAAVRSARPRHAGARSAPGILVARGERAFPLPESGPVAVSVTPAGAALLRREARRGRAPVLSARAVFSGYWSGPVEAGALEPLPSPSRGSLPRASQFRPPSLSIAG
jgi:streptogramin lyase